MQMPVGRATAVAMLLAFVVILGIALVSAPVTDAHGFNLFSAMFHSGALVFGGGHVLLPLLEAETVRTGWVSQDVFPAGMVRPGPAGAVVHLRGSSRYRQQAPAPNGWVGGLIAAVGVFLPSYLLLFGALPFWFRLRSNLAARAASAGVSTRRWWGSWQRRSTIPCSPAPSGTARMPRWRWGPSPAGVVEGACMDRGDGAGVGAVLFGLI